MNSYAARAVYPCTVPYNIKLYTGLHVTLVANSIDESTFNQIASKCEAQSKILRLLDELAVHYQNLWGLGGHP
jgi:hypothetical protein